MEDKYLFWLAIAMMVFALIAILLPVYWFMVL